MAVRTKELAFAALNGTTAVVLYTCPAGATAIVKDWSVHATAAANSFVQVRRGGLTVRVWSGVHSGAGVLSSTGRFVVLEPGDVLEVQGNAALAGGIHVSGTELDGVAP